MTFLPQLSNKTNLELVNIAQGKPTTLSSKAQKDLLSTYNPIGKHGEAISPEQAREILGTGNMEFILKRIKRHKHGIGARCGEEDLAQVASIAVDRAISLFNKAKGKIYRNYVRVGIDQSLNRHIISNREQVSGLGLVTNARYWYERNLDDHTRNDLPIPGVAQIKKTLKISAETLREVKGKPVEIVNADEIYEDIPYGETIPDHNAIMPDEKAAQQEIYDLLHGVLNTLEDREKSIIVKKFLGNELLTNDELGKIFGVSGEAIRQSEIKALKKLKKYFGRLDIKPELLKLR